MGMFVIPEVVVDDRRLGEVLRALAGLTVSIGVPRPVAPDGAKVTNGKVESVGDTIELWANYLHKTKVTDVVAMDMKAFLKRVGRPPQSYSYFITQAQKRGVIKRVSGTKGPGSKYKVVYEATGAK